MSDRGSVESIARAVRIARNLSKSVSTPELHHGGGKTRWRQDAFRTIGKHPRRLAENVLGGAPNRDDEGTAILQIFEITSRQRQAHDAGPHRRRARSNLDTSTLRHALGGA